MGEQPSEGTEEATSERSRVERARVLGHAIVREIRAENLPFMAGSIAYHAFVSLLPFLVLVLLVVAAVGGPEHAAAVVGFTESYLTPGSRSFLTNAVVEGNPGFSLVGGGLLVWGTLKIFRSLDTAFSDIYESETNNSLADQLTDGVVVLAAVGGAVLAAGTVGTVATVSAGVPFAGLVNAALLAGGLAVAFLPIYYVFPDEDVTVREVIPGTLFAAVSWTALQAAFRVYAQVASKAETYGLVGAIIVLLTWLYFSGLTLLTGAAINAVLAGRSEDVEGIVGAAEEEQASVERERVAESLHQVNRAFDEGDRLTVEVGGESVSLPAADHLEHDADPVEGSATLRIEWQR